jgi:hypothetical protein
MYSNKGILTLFHTVRVEFADGGLLISDTQQGHGVHGVGNYFHIHPYAQVDIRVDESLAPFLFEQDTWHPEFNISVSNYRSLGNFYWTVPLTFRSFLALP